MVNVDRYLAALGYHGPREPTPEVLRELHRRHLIMVPYDSSANIGKGPELWAHVDIDTGAAFQEIIEGGRGGVCTELNGLFRALLGALGFDVGILSAGTRQMDGGFGPDLEHVFNWVHFGDRTVLADVGFVGPSYLDPLWLNDEIQRQYGNLFTLDEQQGYRVLYRKGRAGDWQAVYRFRPTARSLAEWDVPSPELAAFSRQLVAAGTVIQGRAFEHGQKILIGTRFLQVTDGHEEMRVLVDPAERARVAADILRQSS